MEFLEDLPAGDTLLAAEGHRTRQPRHQGAARHGRSFRSIPRTTSIARIDAVGLCFSDIKLISAGSTHPRIEGRNLAKSPTVPGHEVAMTIVGVGDKWKGKFTLGSRYIIQADIYYKGKGVAFGYAIPGGLSQYAVIGTEILEGDEGCYLLPVKNRHRLRRGRPGRALDVRHCLLPDPCTAGREGRAAAFSSPASRRGRSPWTSPAWRARAPRRSSIPGSAPRT